MKNDGYLQDNSLMGQTDNSSLGFEFSNVFSNILLESKHTLCVCTGTVYFVLHYVFSDTSSTQLEQDTQGKIYCNMKFIDFIGLFCTALRS